MVRETVDKDRTIESEAELASYVVAWLKANGWEDIHQEVRYYEGGPRADIVAKKGELLWIIECKMHFNLEVMYQANNWLGKAHFISIAVPKVRYKKAVQYFDGTQEHGNRRKIDVLYFAADIMGDKGIGVLEVEKVCYGGSTLGHVSTLRTAKQLQPTMAESLRQHLHEEQKDSQAGTTGTFFTPFKRTAAKVQEYVKANPGCTVREMVAGIEHHYSMDSTARQKLLGLIRDGVIKDIVAKDERKEWRLYPSAS